LRCIALNSGACKRKKRDRSRLKRQVEVKSGGSLCHRLRFFFDEDFYFGDDVAEDFDLDGVFAKSFEGLR